MTNVTTEATTINKSGQMTGYVGWDTAVLWRQGAYSIASFIYDRRWFLRTQSSFTEAGIEEIIFPYEYYSSKALVYNWYQFICLAVTWIVNELF